VRLHVVEVRGQVVFWGLGHRDSVVPRKRH
jgi:hypothetical protein